MTLAPNLWWMKTGAARARGFGLAVAVVFFGVPAFGYWWLGACWYVHLGYVEAQWVCRAGPPFNGVSIPKARRLTLV
ncbi:MAG: hypothetical protein AB7R67_21735 [Vicinamibacterales bacterium]